MREKLNGEVGSSIIMEEDKTIEQETMRKAKTTVMSMGIMLMTLDQLIVDKEFTDLAAFMIAKVVNKIQIGTLTLKRPNLKLRCHSSLLIHLELEDPIMLLAQRETRKKDVSSQVRFILAQMEFRLMKIMNSQNLQRIRRKILRQLTVSMNTT